MADTIIGAAAFETTMVAGPPVTSRALAKGLDVFLASGRAFAVLLSSIKLREGRERRSQSGILAKKKGTHKMVKTPVDASIIMKSPQTSDPATAFMENAVPTPFCEATIVNREMRGAAGLAFPN